MKAFYRSHIKYGLLDNPLNVLKSASTDTCHHVQMCEFFFLYSLKHVHPIQLIINIFPHPDPHSSHLLHLLSPSLFSSHFPMQMITYSSHQKGNSFMVTNYVWMHCLFMLIVYRSVTNVMVRLIIISACLLACVINSCVIYIIASIFVTICLQLRV